MFADYPARAASERCHVPAKRRVLTFSLGGLSKSAGLPQMKLAWMGVAGPPPRVRAALARLEIIADTYLSVSTPVQQRPPPCSDRAPAGRSRAIAGAAGDNLRASDASWRAHPALSLVEPEGGWSAVVRVPAILSEERSCCALLTEASVLVHPGLLLRLSTGGLRRGEPAARAGDIFAEGSRRLAHVATVGAA